MLCGGGGGVHKVLMSLHLNSSCVFSKDLALIDVLDIILKYKKKYKSFPTQFFSYISKNKKKAKTHLLGLVEKLF